MPNKVIWIFLGEILVLFFFHNKFGSPVVNALEKTALAAIKSSGDSRTPKSARFGGKGNSCNLIFSWYKQEPNWLFSQIDPILLL